MTNDRTAISKELLVLILELIIVSKQLIKEEKENEKEKGWREGFDGRTTH